MLPSIALDGHDGDPDDVWAPPVNEDHMRQFRARDALLCSENLRRSLESVDLREQWPDDPLTDLDRVAHNPLTTAGALWSYRREWTKARQERLARDTRFRPDRR